MVQTEKNVNGLTVEPVMTNTSSNQLAPNVFDTPRTLSPSTSVNGSLNKQTHAKPTFTLNADADLEKGSLTPMDSTRNLALSPLYSPCQDFKVNSQVQECSVWPSKTTLKAKAHNEKCHRRAANCYGLTAVWGNMSKKQRLYAKILLALCLLALVAGLGVGVTRAVGGGVWSSQGSAKTIPKTD